MYSVIVVVVDYIWSIRYAHTDSQTVVRTRIKGKNFEWDEGTARSVLIGYSEIGDQSDR